MFIIPLNPFDKKSFFPEKILYPNKVIVGNSAISSQLTNRFLSILLKGKIFTKNMPENYHSKIIIINISKKYNMNLPKIQSII